MRIHKSNNSHQVAVKSATTSGTTFYEVELDQAIEILNKSKDNIFIVHELETRGWAAVDTENHLFGSAIIDDKLYICNTDCQDIMVNGDMVNPETALEDCHIDDLVEYIKPATDKIVNMYLTDYEVPIRDIDESAIELLSQGYNFIDLAKAADDMGLLD